MNNRKARGTQVRRESSDRSKSPAFDARSSSGVICALHPPPYTRLTPVLLPLCLCLCLRLCLCLAAFSPDPTCPTSYRTHIAHPKRVVSPHLVSPRSHRRLSMADQLTKPIPQPDPPYLTDDQTTLLRAALDSQSRPQHPSMPTTGTTPTNSTFIKTDDSSPAGQMNAVSAANSAALFMSPHTTNMDTFATDYTPGFDYLDNDESFDFEDADLGGDMIGALPGSNGEVHEKRKSPDEGAGTPEHDSKRQETNNNGEKTAKKPGRKPLVNEPTTVCVHLTHPPCCDDDDDVY